MKKHSQSVNKIAEESLHAFRHEEPFQRESSKKIPHDNVFHISYMSSVDTRGQTVPEECALYIRGRATAFVLDILCESQTNPSMTVMRLYPPPFKKTRQKPLNKTKKSTDVLASGGSNYTIVQTVFRLGSNRTALPSTDFALVLYMGFSKAACPLLFSWTEQPVYWVFGVVLSDKTQHQNVIRIQSATALRVCSGIIRKHLIMITFNNLQTS